jgi:hypothetical protein
VNRADAVPISSGRGRRRNRQYRPCADRGEARPEMVRAKVQLSRTAVVVSPSRPYSCTLRISGLNQGSKTATRSSRRNSPTRCRQPMFFSVLRDATKSIRSRRSLVHQACPSLASSDVGEIRPSVPAALHTLTNQIKVGFQKIVILEIGSTKPVPALLISTRGLHASADASGQQCP